MTSDEKRIVSRIQNAIDSLNTVIALAEQGETDNAKVLCFDLYKRVFSILGGTDRVTAKYNEFMRLWGRVYYSLYEKGEQK